jgi:hypothetical protein
MSSVLVAIVDGCLLQRACNTGLQYGFHSVPALCWPSGLAISVVICSCILIWGYVAVGCQLVLMRSLEDLCFQWYGPVLRVRMQDLRIGRVGEWWLARCRSLWRSKPVPWWRWCLHCDRLTQYATVPQTT